MRVVIACLSMFVAAPAFASIAYVMDANGNITRVDPYSQDPVSPIGGGGWTSTASGFTIDENGVGWGIDWSGTLRRYDLGAGTSSSAGIVPRPNGIGFYKDFAWDPIRHRMLALYLGPGSGGSGLSILEVHPSNATYTLLGPVNGLGQFSSPTSLAMSPAGVLTIADETSGIVYDLTQGNVAFLATRRPGGGFGGLSFFTGLEYDPATSDLFTSGPIYQVMLDGSVQFRRSSPAGMDIAFVPIPGLSTAGALALGAIATGRTRRR